MVVAVKRKTSPMSPTVRFTTIPSTMTERSGILRTDVRRLTKLPLENNQENPKENRFSLSPLWTLSTLILLCAIVALSYRGYLDTLAINYPFQGPKVIQKNSGVDQVLWGTYRPGAYLGLRTKEPLDRGSVVAGLMWYKQYDLMMTESIDSSIRHMCDNSHKDLVYGYLEHDTVNYGHQVINDGKDRNKFTLQTIFLRPHNDKNTDTLNYHSNTDWTTRIIYETNSSTSSVSLVWYVYIDPGDVDQPLSSKKYSLDVQKSDNKTIATIFGTTPSLTDFRMSIIPRTSNNNLLNLNQFSVHLNTSISNTWCSNTAQLKHCLAKSMILRRNSLKDPGAGSQIMLMEKNTNLHDDDQHKSNNLLNNFMAVQITITHNNKKSSENQSKFKRLSLTFDVAYTQKNKQKSYVFINSVPSLVDNKFDLVHKEYSHRFQKKFEKSFPIKLKEDIIEKKSLLTFAKVTFSNMAGSLGYFYGSSLVRDDDDEDIQKKSEVSIEDAVKYWTAGLLTAVPSRSQFPRGFLWDDGFHGLMLGSYDIELQLNILGHWMDLLNHQGWIPREQILGSEARSRVPEEFVVQSSRAANPPALLLTVNILLKQIKQKQQTKTSYNDNDFDKIDNTLRRLYPRLKAWYTWFNRTQRAVNSYAKNFKLSTDSNDLFLAKKFVGYRWRGRDSITNKELNPKTLTSGMDDYPRSSHPVNDDGSSNLPMDSPMNDFDASERHVDLHCWMAHGARIMSYLHIYLKPDISSYDNEYSRHFWMLVESLDRLHWTEGSSDTFQSSNPMYADYGVHSDNVKLVKVKRTNDYVRIVGEDFPKWRFVDSHIGYNALFPLFFRLVKNSQRLNAILDLIEGTSNNSSLLTKSCGLRSLAKSSPLYKVRNTLHDPPYWRGTVWINMQYLACSSLYYYANLPVDSNSAYASNKYEKLEPIQYLDIKTKKRCEKLYNKIRNDVIQCVYKEWLRTGYVWEQYSDDLVWDSSFGFFHKGLGTRPFTGWSANVVLLMAEIY